MPAPLRPFVRRIGACRPLPVVLTALAALASLTVLAGGAAAQDPVHHPTLLDDNRQHTLQVDAVVPLAGRLAVNGSVLYAGAPAHQTVRFAIEMRATRWFSLSAGYGETRSAVAAASGAIDHVYRAAATAQHGVGAWTFSNRALIEMHRHAGREQSSFRDRVRAELAPWRHARTSFFASGEGEEVYHSTIASVATGWRRANASVGVRHSLQRGVSAELYSLRAMVRGHAPSTSIGFRLSLRLDARGAN